MSSLQQGRVDGEISFLQHEPEIAQILLFTSRWTESRQYPLQQGLGKVVFTLSRNAGQLQLLSLWKNGRIAFCGSASSLSHPSNKY